MTAGQWLALAILGLIFALPFILIAAAAPMNSYDPDPEFDEEHERYLNDES